MYIYKIIAIVFTIPTLFLGTVLFLQWGFENDFKFYPQGKIGDCPATAYFPEINPALECQKLSAITTNEDWSYTSCLKELTKDSVKKFQVD